MIIEYVMASWPCSQIHGEKHWSNHLSGYLREQHLRDPCSSTRHKDLGSVPTFLPWSRVAQGKGLKAWPCSTQKMMVHGCQSRGLTYEALGYRGRGGPPYHGDGLQPFRPTQVLLVSNLHQDLGSWGIERSVSLKSYRWAPSLSRGKFFMLLPLLWVLLGPSFIAALWFLLNMVSIHFLPNQHHLFNVNVSCSSY